MAKNLTDAEKAVQLVCRVTGNPKLAVEKSVGEMNPVEVATLAQAFDDNTPHVANQVLHHVANRLGMEQTARERASKAAEATKPAEAKPAAK